MILTINFDPSLLISNAIAMGLSNPYNLSNAFTCHTYVITN